LPARLFIPHAFENFSQPSPPHCFSGEMNQVTGMLLRMDGLDVIAIPQPSHAWLSGQLARAWGNDQFAAPVPNEEFCLAAEQHDIGWLAREDAPALDAGTGLPVPFSKVAPKEHIRLWREGVRRARLFGRYPSLLVSRHADTIYTRYFDFAKAGLEDAAAVRAFLDEQHGLQTSLAASLRDDPAYGGQASPENIVRNQRLIAALDWLSLDICWGVEKETQIPDVPTLGEGRTELRLCPRQGENLVRDELILDPWPFREASLTVRAEGKRLRGRFSTQDELLRALDKAEPVLVTAVLHRAS
jgi:hypothetical protein